MCVGGGRAAHTFFSVTHNICVTICSEDDQPREDDDDNDDGDDDDDEEEDEGNGDDSHSEDLTRKQRKRTVRKQNTIHFDFDIEIITKC